MQPKDLIAQLANLRQGVRYEDGSRAAVNNLPHLLCALLLECAVDMADIESFEEVCCLDLSDVSGLEEFNRDELLCEIELANGSYIISPEVELEGKCKFIKRVVRKFTYFLVRQFAEKLTEYNTHMIRSLNQIRNYIFCTHEDGNAFEEVLFPDEVLQ